MEVDSEDVSWSGSEYSMDGGSEYSKDGGSDFTRAVNTRGAWGSAEARESWRTSWPWSTWRSRSSWSAIATRLSRDTIATRNPCGPCIDVDLLNILTNEIFVAFNEVKLAPEPLLEALNTFKNVMETKLNLFKNDCNCNCASQKSKLYIFFLIFYYLIVLILVYFLPGSPWGPPCPGGPSLLQTMNGQLSILQIYITLYFFLVGVHAVSLLHTRAKIARHEGITGNLRAVGVHLV